LRTRRSTQPANKRGQPFAVTGCGDSRSMRLASPGRAQDATAVGKGRGMGAGGKGQWTVAADTRERDEEKRGRARRWGLGGRGLVGHGLLGCLSVPPFRAQTRPCPSTSTQASLTLGRGSATSPEGTRAVALRARSCGGL
jgi:hypothetical protein